MLKYKKIKIYNENMDFNKFIDLIGEENSQNKILRKFQEHTVKEFLECKMSFVDKHFFETQIIKFNKEKRIFWTKLYNKNVINYEEEKQLPWSQILENQIFEEIDSVDLLKFIKYCSTIGYDELETKFIKKLFDFDLDLIESFLNLNKEFFKTEMYDLKKELNEKFIFFDEDCDFQQKQEFDLDTAIIVRREKLNDRFQDNEINQITNNVLFRRHTMDEEFINKITPFFDEDFVKWCKNKHLEIKEGFENYKKMEFKDYEDLLFGYSELDRLQELYRENDGWLFSYFG